MPTGRNLTDEGEERRGPDAGKGGMGERTSGPT